MGDRRQESEHFIHVQERSKVRGAGLRSHPTHDLGQEQGDEEHPLLFRQMGEGEHGQPGLAARVIEQAIDVQRLAAQRHLEARRCQQSVESARQLKAFVGGIERFEFQHSDATHGRLLD